MKKQGFTLAEILITIGIIGIAAALIAPSFTKLIPKKEKVEFMECLNQLNIALSSVDYSPKEIIEIDGLKYPNCVGIACACGEIAGIDLKGYSFDIDKTKEEKVSESSKYFKGQKVGFTRIYEEVDFICKTPSNYSFTFTVDNDGTIINLNGKDDFMKDQTNYFKDGTEE